MEEYKGVVFFDYDGTTIDEAENIMAATPKTVESLQKLKENGYLTMLCSGRSKRFLEADSDKFQGVITCNGSYGEAAGEILRDIHISEDIVQHVIDKYFQRDITIHLETQNVTYYMYNDLEFYQYFRKRLGFPDAWFVPWELRKEEEHITKIVIHYKTSDILDDFKKDYAGQLECVKPFENENLFDVTLRGVTKGDAITELLERFHIDRKDSYAFGDSNNDVEMLKTVGTGIVMGKHSESAGKAASMITGTVKEEGITQALERLGLIS